MIAKIMLHAGLTASISVTVIALSSGFETGGQLWFGWFTIFVVFFISGKLSSYINQKEASDEV